MIIKFYDTQDGDLPSKYVGEARFKMGGKVEFVNCSERKIKALNTSEVLDLKTRKYILPDAGLDWMLYAPLQYSGSAGGVGVYFEADDGIPDDVKARCPRWIK